jgi:WS/DGAT/MGAT family acyltransferase
LSALDRVFLDLDTAETAQQVGWVIRFEGDPPSLEEFQAHVEPRLVDLPLFTMRLGRSRRRLGGPRWVPAENFSIADHVLETTTDGDAGISELAGRLLSQRLDRSEPLWRLWLVTGREDGFAVIGHGHHTLIDGIAAVQVAMLLLDPIEARPGPDIPSLRGEILPTTSKKTKKRREKGKVRRLSRGARMMILRGPRTVLDDHGDGIRTIGMGTTDLREARAAAREHGATPNDALMAASSIALTEELETRGGAPEWVKVLMPFKLSSDARGRVAGNEISVVTVELPLGLSDAHDLFGLIAKRTKDAKSLGNAGVMAILAKGAGFIPSPWRPAVTRFVYRNLRFTVIVSNLRGPPVDVGLLGRTATSVHPFVPITQGQGLSIGAMSYRGQLSIGINANAHLIEASEIAALLESAFAKLASGDQRLVNR